MLLATGTAMTDIRERQVDVMRAAGMRWRQHTAERQHKQQQLLIGGPAAAESPQRLEAFHQLEGVRRSRGSSLGLERVIGPSIDFDRVPPNSMAEVAGRPVARIIELPRNGFELSGFGTGFLIAPGILLTNHHVLPDQESAENAAANFGHDYTSHGVQRGEIIAFDATPHRFITDADLDFTIVGLAARLPITTLPLIGSVGKILLGHPINIIQHPSGGPKTYGIRENRLVDILDLHLHYTTDTLPGSSGSPAFNQHWEVVALHHSGVPMMQGDRILTKRGDVWDPKTMSDEDIQWVANEGVRVSSIVAYLEHLRSHPQLGAFAAAALGAFMTSTSLQPESIATTSSENPMQPSINIYGPTTINLSSVASQPPVSIPALAIPAVARSMDAPEGVSIDQDYGTRGGYEPGFLGNGAFQLKLPTLSASNERLIAPLKNGDATGVLKYHHFSLVMHAERRLAFFTAVNIDGPTGKRLERNNDKWFFDPRMDKGYQIGEELYRSNPLDRGHLVRRLDPVWGPLRVAKGANDDTFHFTNCSPQHANLNQKIWNELEDYLLDHTASDAIRLTVFTGPVFADDDPTYRGVQLPRRFWKVAVMKATDGKLLAAAFIQSQAEMIRGLEEADFLRQELRTDQIPVAEIEALTGLIFGIPSGADPLTGDASLTRLESVGRPVRKLREVEDIKLR